jgi:hypothetical protein
MSPAWISSREAQRLRAIALEDVLERWGARPDPHDKAKWHGARGTISVTGMKFMNWTGGQGGGGAIDLTIQLLGVGFIEAVHWLQQRFPQSPEGFGLSPPTKTSRLPPLAPARAPGSPTALALPPKAPDNLGRVRHYLLQERRLPAHVIDPLIDAGVLYADRRANAVFLLLGKENQSVGAELRGTGPIPWRALAAGSRKDWGYFSMDLALHRAIILCESAIDALSCFALHRDCLCISTAGARAHPLWLAALIQQGRPIYCGFDADPAGDGAARAMIASHPAIQRLRPTRQDWNEMLM